MARWNRTSYFWNPDLEQTIYISRQIWENGKFIVKLLYLIHIDIYIYFYSYETSTSLLDLRIILITYASLSP